MPAVPNANDLLTPPPDEELLYEIDDVVTVNTTAIHGDTPTYAVGRVETALAIRTASGQRVFVYEITFDDPLERGDDSLDETEWYGAGELQPYEAPEHPEPAE